MEKQKPFTSLSILESNYRKWPPNGLDYAETERLQREVFIKGFGERADEERKSFSRKGIFFGYVTGKDDAGREFNDPNRRIYLNDSVLSGRGNLVPSIVSALLIATLSVEALVTAGIADFWTSYGSTLMSAAVNGSLLVADRQCSPAVLTLAKWGSSTLMALGWASYGSVLASSYRNEAISSMLYPLGALAFPNAASAHEVIAHEHIHILQNKDGDYFGNGFIPAKAPNFFQKAEKKQLSLVGMIDNVVERCFGNDLIKDREIQARMHTVLMHGYQRWGSLPRTREELWAAMIDGGLRPSKEISAEVAVALKTQPNIKTFMTTSTVFKLASSFIDPPIAQLNTAGNRFAAMRRRNFFWRQTLPYLYGYLLELYGDPKGREKMGFDKSCSIETIAADALKKEPLDPTMKDRILRKRPPPAASPR